MNAVAPRLEAEAGGRRRGRYRAEWLVALHQLYRASLDQVEVLAYPQWQPDSKHSPPVRRRHRPVAELVRTVSALDCHHSPCRSK